MKTTRYIILIVFIALGLTGYGCFHDDDGLEMPNPNDSNWGQVIWD